MEKRFIPEKIWSHFKVFLKYDSELGFLKSQTHCNNHDRLTTDVAYQRNTTALVAMATTPVTHLVSHTYGIKFECLGQAGLVVLGNAPVFLTGRFVLNAMDAKQLTHFHRFLKEPVNVYGYHGSIGSRDGK